MPKNLNVSIFIITFKKTPSPTPRPFIHVHESTKMGYGTQVTITACEPPVIISHYKFKSVRNIRLRGYLFLAFYYKTTEFLECVIHICMYIHIYQLKVKLC